MSTGVEESRDVALLVETSNAYARGLLSGVREYVAAHRRWSLYLVEHSREETDFSWLEGWVGHGVLARIENVETARFIRGLRLPTVDLSAGRLAPELPGVETNDEIIAGWAVQHFADRGIRNFGFCGVSRFPWSHKRAAAFAAHVRARGSRTHQIVMRSSGPRAEHRALLARWLRSLPTPVGILACYDIAGQEVLEACKLAKLDVPDQVAVMGVDNDELISALTTPPLSSIEPDKRRTGYLAAELLDRMMSGEKVRPGLRLVAPLRVVARQSSEILSVDDHLVSSALRFIRDHGDVNVTVQDVTRHVGISRRALDYRFLAQIGKTVHQEIVRARMAKVSELLLTTDWTLSRIAERLEFSQPEYMGAAFKKFSGKPPGRYRSDMRDLPAL